MLDESIESDIYACDYTQGWRQPSCDSVKVDTSLKENVDEVMHRLRIRSYGEDLAQLNISQF